MRVENGPKEGEGWRLWRIREITQESADEESSTINYPDGTKVQFTGARIVTEEVLQVNVDTEEDHTYIRRRWDYDSRVIDSPGQGRYAEKSVNNGNSDQWTYEKLPDSKINP